MTVRPRVSTGRLRASSGALAVPVGHLVPLPPAAAVWTKAVHGYCHAAGDGGGASILTKIMWGIYLVHCLLWEMVTPAPFPHTKDGAPRQVAPPPWPRAWRPRVKLTIFSSLK